LSSITVLIRILIYEFVVIGNAGAWLPHLAGVLRIEQKEKRELGSRTPDRRVRKVLAFGVFGGKSAIESSRIGAEVRT